MTQQERSNNKYFALAYIYIYIYIYIYYPFMWMFKKENSGTDEYVLNWNHGFNNGNIKPK